MPNKKTEGYLATPKTGSGPAVLVLHAWWGLNDFFRDFCDRLAQQGYLALAPDMFGGEVVHTVEEAQQHQSQWDEEKAVPPIILPAIEDLAKRSTTAGPSVGVIGFSMGGYWSLWLAQKKPEIIRSVVLFYGTNGGGGDFGQSKADFQGHFAEKDPYESLEVVDKLEKNLKSANRPAKFYTYPGTGHWFFEKDRPDAYNAQAAQLAWERTLAFLKRPV